MRTGYVRRTVYAPPMGPLIYVFEEELSIDSSLIAESLVFGFISTSSFFDLPLS